MVCVWNFEWHGDVIKWKYLPRYWPFVRGIHRSPVDFPHKGQWRGALMFSLICACTNGWANNRDAGYLRRHRAHYDVTVMNISNNMCSLISHISQIFNILRSRQNGRPFADDIFKYFLKWKPFNFEQNFIEIFSLQSNRQYLSIGSVNGLAPNRRQAIIWSNDDPVHRRIYASPGVNELTHWGRDKMDAISQTTFSSAFSWMKMFEFRLKFHWSLFLRVQLTIIQHWFR